MAKAPFGKWLKDRLTEHGMSLRSLGKATGIDPATLSRISSAKQQPTLPHLERIARALEIPLTRAIEAAGFDIAGSPAGKENRATDAGNSRRLDTAIHRTAASLTDRLDRLADALLEYRILAGTEQGRTLINERTAEKLRQSGAHGQFLSQVRALHSIAVDERTPLHRRSLAGSALLYFILEADVIPDSEFPVGYVDDAIAVQTIWEMVSSAGEGQEER